VPVPATISSRASAGSEAQSAAAPQTGHPSRWCAWPSGSFNRVETQVPDHFAWSLLTLEGMLASATLFDTRVAGPQAPADRHVARTDADLRGQLPVRLSIRKCSGSNARSTKGHSRRAGRVIRPLIPDGTNMTASHDDHSRTRNQRKIELERLRHRGQQRYLRSGRRPKIYAMPTRTSAEKRESPRPCISLSSGSSSISAACVALRGGSSIVGWASITPNYADRSVRCARGGCIFAARSGPDGLPSSPLTLTGEGPGLARVAG